MKIVGISYKPVKLFICNKIDVAKAQFNCLTNPSAKADGNE
jgi:hypothetical protein